MIGFEQRAILKGMDQWPITDDVNKHPAGASVNQPLNSMSHESLQATARQRLAQLMEAGPATAATLQCLPREGLPQESLVQLQALPLALDTEVLVLATPLASSTHLKRQLAFACKRSIHLLPAPAPSFSQWLAAYAAKETIAPLDTLTASQADRDIKALAARCIGARGSDIHLEPSAADYRVRLRIDGNLRQVEQLEHDQGQRCIMRLKLMAGLDISEQRLPQDGVVTIALSRHQLAEFRLATLPTILGEKVTLRLVDSPDLTLSLAHLGMSSQQQCLFSKALSSSRGLILVCGPTGSGKTATLYSALMHIDRRKRHVISVENPVEHRLPSVQQVQVEPRIGLDFSRVLKAFLRHDPDVIMVGEIRDAESAEITLRAAQTGHLVLATVHATHASGCWSRLQQLGITATELASCLQLVIAQRLVPLLCKSCRSPASLPTAAPLRFATHPQGCAHCHEGHFGRTGIFEFATPPFSHPNDAMSALIRDGWAKVDQGLISPEALKRVL